MLPSKVLIKNVPLGSVAEYCSYVDSIPKHLAIKRDDDGNGGDDRNTGQNNNDDGSSRRNAVGRNGLGGGNSDDVKDLVVFSEHADTYYLAGSYVTIQLPADKFLYGQIEKKFVGFGRKKKYVGSTKSYNFTERFFLIKFKDDDEEEMDAAEIDEYRIKVRRNVPNNGPSVYDHQATTHRAKITKRNLDRTYDLKLDHRICSRCIVIANVPSSYFRQFQGCVF